jgi:hypothetical protein
MKKIIQISIPILLLLSIFGSIIQAEENLMEESNIINIKFTEPIITINNNIAEILIKQTNSYTAEINKPMLPCYEQTIYYPIGQNIKNIKIEKENIKTIPIETEIKTVPQPILSNNNIIKQENHEIVTINDNTPYPSKDYEYSVGQGLNNGLRTNILKLNIYPAKYIPLENKIEWAENIDIEIEYETLFVPTLANQEYSYVIITADEFSNTLTSFENYKNNRGITTKKVTLTEIYGSTFFPSEGRDDAEMIKYFIKNAIEQWGTLYVLLVGGDSELPTRETHIYVDYNEGDDEIFISDLYFADIYNENMEFVSWDSNENDVFGEYEWGPSELTDEVDIYPDVYLGRLAVVDSSELQGILNKITTYETGESWTKDWFSNIVVIGGDTIPNEESNIDEGEYVNQAILNVMDEFLPNPIWDSNNRLSGLAPTGVDNIENDIIDGCGFLDWAGHGATYVWTTYPHNGTRQSLPTPTGRYTNSQILDLENQEKLPIVVTGACSVAKFNQDTDCFTWAFVLNPNGGGIASTGPSGLSWGSSSEATINYLEGRMQVSLFRAYDEGVETFGQMWVEGINTYIRPNMDGGHTKTGVQWQPFGDPTLKIASDSQPPLKPEPPVGPTTGSIREDQTYTAVTTDPEGNNIYYLFDWGDDTISPWLGPFDSGDECEASHSWNSRGNYEIKVKARDTNGKISEWSDPLPISMPKAKNDIFNNMIIFRNILDQFPILKEILNLFISL